MAEKKKLEAKKRAPRKKPNRMKTSTKAKYLFTAEEMIDLAREQAGKAQRIAELTEEKAAIAEQYKGKIKAEEAEINRIANLVVSGDEFRSYAAMVEYFPKLAKKKFFDENTGKLIKEEPMDKDDFSQDLRLSPAPGVSKIVAMPDPERPDGEQKTAQAQADAIKKGAKAEGKKRAKAKAKDIVPKSQGQIADALGKAARDKADRKQKALKDGEK